MKDFYSDKDISRGFAWYAQHKDHVDSLVKIQKDSFPMSGSDISRPELWKAGGWKWFFQQYRHPILKP